MSDDIESSVTLSADALAALHEFYAERDAHAEKLEKLRAQVEVDDRDRAARESAPELSIHTFTEDWNESQFWYSDETANLLANQLLDGTSDGSIIAVVSTPSVFVALKNIMAAAGYAGPKPKTYLLEHDKRFAVFPEFLLYDFAQPFNLPPHLKGTVDCLICDPPFLSEDCQTKSERMAPLINRLYRPLGVQTTTYEPVHQGLKNEFCCYANFECEAWRWKKKEDVATGREQ